MVLLPLLRPLQLLQFFLLLLLPLLQAHLVALLQNIPDRAAFLEVYRVSRFAAAAAAAVVAAAVAAAAAAFHCLLPWSMRQQQQRGV